jgi:hypothetical protein
MSEIEWPAEGGDIAACVGEARNNRTPPTIRARARPVELSMNTMFPPPPLSWRSPLTIRRHAKGCLVYRALTTIGFFVETSERSACKSKSSDCRLDPSRHMTEPQSQSAFVPSTNSTNIRASVRARSLVGALNKTMLWFDVRL